MENVAILARYRNFPFSIINSQLLLLVFFSELLHKVDELLNAFDRHCVIDGSTHTAYRTVTLQDMPAAMDSLANFASSSSLPVRKVTFMWLRESFAATVL